MSNSISPYILLAVVAIYFLLLMVISYFTSKDSDSESFFIANKKSPWILVSIGMIGATLSGVTLISIPGVVGAGGLNQSYSYMQVVLGYLVGYFIIATVLMPIYYRLNLTTIYGYFEERFGTNAHKVGAAYFILSRIIGASFRLFLVAIILQKFVMDAFGIPFFVTVLLTIILIWIYTYRGGIKTIVWTDTIQTVCMITAVVLTIIAIGNELGVGISGIPALIKESDYTQMFFFDGGWSDPNNFYKQFFGGALIAIVMTGMDQDMMQKNLTCKSIGEAQKNMFTFSIILVFAKFLFLSLGILLYLYAAHVGLEIPAKTDQLFPTIALSYLSPVIGIAFIVGLIAAAYSSADSALTSLTTSFCVDFLGFNKKDIPEEQKRSTRLKVHIGFSIVLLVVIVIFKGLNNDAIINELFTVAGYTYGPILGLFMFGLFTSRSINDNLVIPVCIVAPIVTYLINTNSELLFGGFKFGFLMYALSGGITFLGLLLISKSKASK